MAEYQKRNVVDVKALKKNEFGQYIVDDLNKFQRTNVWRRTEHPCSVEDPFACLECPYTDCIAPATIAQQGASHPNDHMYDDEGRMVPREDGSWMPQHRFSSKVGVRRRQIGFYDTL